MTLEDIQNQNFDGLIVTGAPLGLVDFSDVCYWDQIERVIAWAKEHVTSTLFVCWAVQAALKVLYDLPKFTRKEKLSGVYSHETVKPFALLTRGFDASFYAPHSRYADFPEDYIRQNTDLDILASSSEAGAYLFASKDKRLAFVTGHPEYDAETLSQEYWRDVEAGLTPELPCNYFKNDDPNNDPEVRWRSHGHLLFSNWLNYYVYQITPFDLTHMAPTLE
ncbi:Homoserine O-succinyltransferase [Providencia rustigianii]|nr:Homoserine O-succinyltransferase [Providencia rustigianii]